MIKELIYKNFINSYNNIYSLAKLNTTIIDKINDSENIGFYIINQFKINCVNNIQLLVPRINNIAIYQLDNQPYFDETFLKCNNDPIKLNDSASIKFIGNINYSNSNNNILSKNISRNIRHLIKKSKNNNNMIIGIIAPLEAELRDFVIDNERIIYKYDTIIKTGTLSNIPVILCKGGVGKVNCAMMAQILIDNYKTTHIILVGVAGANDPKINIGDIVISTDSLYHDMDVTDLGYRLGEIPNEDISVFKADKYLINCAYNASKRYINNVYKGRIITGDKFIANKDDKYFLYNKFNSMCIEMEGAAVGHVCYKNNIPYVIIRLISDGAEESAGVEFTDFINEASKILYQISKTMLKYIHNNDC